MKYTATEKVILQGKGAYNHKQGMQEQINE